MIKTFLKGDNIVVLVLTLCFMIPVVFLLSGILNKVDYKHILDHGVETEAIVDPDSYRSNVQVNDVSYFCINYYFYDENDNVHIGTTSESYNYHEIVKIVDRGVITIKYDPNTYDSIEASYMAELDKGHTTQILFIVVFGFIDLVFWIVLLKAIINSIIYARVEKYGKEYNAIVTHIKSFSRGVKYKVYYTWIDDRGRNCSGSSSSKYFYIEALALENQKHIKIKSVGKYSCIVTIPNTKEFIDCVENSNVSGAEIDGAYAKYRVCNYCRKILKVSEKYCPDCGEKVDDE